MKNVTCSSLYQHGETQQPIASFLLTYCCLRGSLKPLSQTILLHSKNQEAVMLYSYITDVLSLLA